MPSIVFPEDFMWGAATSSYQIEGAVAEDGRGPSIWDTFSHTPGKVHNGDTGDVACDHYHMYRQDVAIMRGLGLKGYRFSTAWPRIFPKGGGRANQKGIDFYKSLVEELLKNNIEPMATLYHWDLPQALQDKGGWKNRDTVKYFTEYAWTMFEALGDMVKLWITHNEPLCTAFLGNATGENAPGYTDPALALQVSHSLLLSHAEAVNVYKQENYGGKIGITINLYPIHPATQSAKDVETAKFVDGIFNRWFLDPVIKGVYPNDVLRVYKDRFKAPVIEPGDTELIADSEIDFLGVNYYTRNVVRYSEEDSLLGYEQINPEGVRYTGIGWEIYPEGLYEILNRIRKDYGNPTVYITENGAAFKDDRVVNGVIEDKDRIDYIKQHLIEVNKAIRDGASVKGYFLWSLMDNFEWADGYSQRFGIIHVDFNTLERTWKRSAYWYRDVINNNGF